MSVQLFSLSQIARLWCFLRKLALIQRYKYTLSLVAYTLYQLKKSSKEKPLVYILAEKVSLSHSASRNLTLKKQNLRIMDA